MSKSSSKRRIIIKKRAKELISLVGLTAVSFGLIDKLESNDDIALQSVSIVTWSCQCLLFVVNLS